MGTRHIPPLRREADGYFRVRWTGPDRCRHARSFGTHRADAQVRYAAFCAQWMADERVRAPGVLADPTVAQAWARYRPWAAAHYRDALGQPTGEAVNMDHAVAHMLDLHGEALLRDLTPTRLREVRQAMVDAGLSRRVVNKRVSRVRRFVRWCVAHEMVRPDVLAMLEQVEELRPGRSGAREKPRVRPVADEWVQRVIAAMPPTLAAMLTLQWLTGMRSGELVIMRPVDIDTSGDVWIYTPADHKTAHLGHRRRIGLGPRCQEALAPFLDRTVDAYCFDPTQGRREAFALTAARPGSGLGQRRPAPKTDKRTGAHYTPNSYLGAVKRWCARANVPDFHPHQLRHSTEVRLERLLGREAARAALGHVSIDTTAAYADADLPTIMKAARQAM